MDFIFCGGDEYDAKSLLQGDILLRTQLLADSISQAHRYYAEAEDYSHFAILTQSCDLVRRSNEGPHAKYITIAAIRPVHVALQRFVERYRDKKIELPLRVCDLKAEQAAKQFLERLLNNTAEGYFFLKKGSVDTITEDCCVFLPLSIALRTSEHYDACLKAKVGQMNDVFAAKLGWLTGNMYSRVGTPDIYDRIAQPDKFKDEFVRDALEGSAIYWLSKRQTKVLRDEIANWRKGRADQAVPKEILEDILSNLPNDASILADAVVSHLKARGFIINDDDTLQRAKQTLVNFPTFESLARQR